MKIDKLIKRVCLSVVGAGTSLLIAACYGAQMYDYERNMVVEGRVSSEDVQGVQGLEVCANVPGYGSECVYTNVYGEYRVFSDIDLLNHADSKGFWVVVRDVDGAENGLYEGEEIPVDSGSVPAKVDVLVEEIPQ